MFISIIVALDQQRAIGRNNQLPWHLPADLKYFKNTTMAKPIVMGRKTYESIGHVLPGRRNIIISRNPNLRIPGGEVVHSLEQALQLFAQNSSQGSSESEVFIIGGADIFKQALPIAKRLYITSIKNNFIGDTYFPDWQINNWQEISRISHKADIYNLWDYDFIVLDRVQGKLKN